MDFLLDMSLAVWLGILTSLSPCPMATNIAAISYIGKQVNSSKNMFIASINGISLDNIIEFNGDGPISIFCLPTISDRGSKL